MEEKYGKKKIEEGTMWFYVELYFLYYIYNIVGNNDNYCSLKCKREVETWNKKSLKSWAGCSTSGA